VVQKLSAFGADPDSDENLMRQTPVFIASALGHGEVVKFLASKSVLEKSDEEFRTPLFITSCFGHADVVRTLLDFGADINARNVDGQTPLYCAARGDKVDVVEMLLLGEYT
jgi:ankyrin repeat protein